MCVGLSVGSVTVARRKSLGGKWKSIHRQGSNHSSVRLLAAKGLEVG